MIIFAWKGWFGGGAGVGGNKGREVTGTTFTYFG